MVDAPPEPSGQFALEFDGNRIAITRDEVVIGRSIDCDIQLDDRAVSRRHARIVVRGGEAWVEDLRSSNGVYVNGDRIDAPRRLVPSDRVLIGRHALVLVPVAIDDGPSSSRVATALGRREVTRDEPPETEAFESAKAPSGSAQWEEGTRKGTALELMGSVAEKLIALGRGNEAKRMLEGHLTAVIEAARAERPIDSETLAAATRLALKLAGALPDARWIDYVFNVYAALQKPLPVETVDEIHALARRVKSKDPKALREYLSVLASVRGSLTPAQRFAVKRLEGLERVIALG